jgi:hypothetical protein
MLPGLARANREVQGALGADEGSRFKCMFDHHRAGRTDSRLKEEIDLRAGIKRGEGGRLVHVVEVKEKGTREMSMGRMRD